MKKIIRTLCVLGTILALSSSSCEDIPQTIERIHLMNESDHPINSSVTLRNGPYYPDTSLVTIAGKLMQETPPDRNAYFDYRGNGAIAELIETSPLGLVSIYIFHPDTLAAYSNEQIIEDYKVLARYDLSLSDLETLDFFVPYPPNEAMDSMQVYMP